MGCLTSCFSITEFLCAKYHWYLLGRGSFCDPSMPLSWLLSACVKGDFDDPMYSRQQSCSLIYPTSPSRPTSTTSYHLGWFIQQLQCDLGQAINVGAAGAQPISCVQYLEECCWHLCASAHRDLGVAFIGKIPLSLKSRQQNVPAQLQPLRKLLRQQSEAVSLPAYEQDNSLGFAKYLQHIYTWIWATNPLTHRDALGCEEWCNILKKIIITSSAVELWSPTVQQCNCCKI